jgi:hypothetical protein
MATDEVRHSAVWRPSTKGEIQVYGWTYEDYRKKYDELWQQGWRLQAVQPYVADAGDGLVRQAVAGVPPLRGGIDSGCWLPVFRYCVGGVSVLGEKLSRRTVVTGASVSKWVMAAS